MVGRAREFLQIAKYLLRARPLTLSILQWNETTAGPKTQVNALCLLAAAATVNADFLARSGHASPLVGAALDQIAVPNNATATGEAGSTQRGTTGTSPAERNKSQIGGVAVTILALGAGLLL